VVRRSMASDGSTGSHTSGHWSGGKVGGAAGVPGWRGR